MMILLFLMMVMIDDAVVTVAFTVVVIDDDVDDSDDDIASIVLPLLSCALILSPICFPFYMTSRYFKVAAKCYNFLSRYVSLI